MISSSVHEKQPRPSKRSHKQSGGTRSATDNGGNEVSGTLKDFDAIVKRERDKLKLREE